MNKVDCEILDDAKELFLKPAQTVPTLLANIVVQFAHTRNMLATRKNVGQRWLVLNMFKNVGQHLKSLHWKIYFLSKSSLKKLFTNKTVNKHGEICILWTNVRLNKTEKSQKSVVIHPHHFFIRTGVL